MRRNGRYVLNKIDKLIHIDRQIVVKQGKYRKKYKSRNVIIQ